MGGHYLSNAGEFLISILFGIYILAVMLRLLLQLVRANFYNPVSQFLVKITNPLLVPLRRLIPGFAGIDLASVLLLLILQCVELYLIRLLPMYATPSFSGLMVLAIANLLQLVLTIYFISIFAQVILSWFNAGASNPVANLLYQLNEPFLSRARRIFPPQSGLDLSPILVIIVLGLAHFLIVLPLMDLGSSLAGYYR